MAETASTTLERMGGRDVANAIAANLVGQVVAEPDPELSIADRFSTIIDEDRVD